MNNPAEWEAIHQSRHWGTYPDIYMVRQVRAFIDAWDSPRGPLALDIGCGAGSHTFMMHEMGMIVTAFDASPTAIKRLRHDVRMIPEAEIEAEITPMEMDVASADFPPESFDFILDNLTLTNIERPPWIKIASWLKPGGWFVYASFLTPPKDTPPTWYHQIAGSEFVERQATTRNGETVEVEVFRYVKP